jgi:hypothetical protein
MLDYLEMARNSIISRDDLKGWKDDLSDTCQFELAEDLVDILAGLMLPAHKVYRLAWYIAHVESQK